MSVEGRQVPVPRQLQVNGQAQNHTSHPPSEVLLKIANADQHNTLDFQTYSASTGEHGEEHRARQDRAGGALPLRCTAGTNEPDRR